MEEFVGLWVAYRDEEMIFDDVLEIKNGRNQKSVENPDGKYPIYGSGGVMGYADDYICEAQTVIVGRKGSINNPLYVDEPFWNVDTAFGLCAKRAILLPRYLYYFCRKFDFERLNKAVTIPSLTKSDLLKIEIDLPDLTKQQDVVDKLLKVEQIIDFRKQELQKLDDLIKARFVELFGDPLLDDGRYPKVPLRTLADVGSSKRIFEKEYVTEGVPFYRTKEIVELSKGNRITTELFITRERYDEIRVEYGVPQKGDLLISAVGTIGVIWIVDGKNDFYFKDGNLLRVVATENFAPTYLKHLLEALIGAHKQEMSSGTAYAALTISALKEMPVYVVPIIEQEQFADFVHQVDKSKVAVQNALNEAKMLFDSLMQKYFG